MSFSGEVKVELSKLNNLKNKQEVFIEFLGYLSTANVTREKNGYKFSTSNEYNINRFAKLLNNVEIDDYKISLQGKKYVITFKSKKDITAQLIKENMQSVEMVKAYIRGAFMGSGSITNPENTYHLEIMYQNIDYAKLTLDNLLVYDINAKIIQNNKNIILYIKDGEDISKFLALIGANTSMLKFEEMRVIKDMKNQINRMVNCETANLNKTIDTAVEQISYIKKLRKSGKFDSLSEDLKELAILREKNPNATLTELGKMLKNPISKSSVNYRFKKLKEMLK